MSLLWRDAVRMQPMDHMEMLNHLANWPDKVHVTQAGFTSHFNGPLVKAFLKQRGNNDSAWYRKEDVDLSQPLHSWQPAIVTRHLTKWLNQPKDNTETVKRRGYNDGYAGNNAPTAIRHLGKLIVTDGNHRVAAEMLRGSTPHMRMWVYDADKHGFMDIGRRHWNPDSGQSESLYPEDHPNHPKNWKPISRNWNDKWWDSWGNGFHGSSRGTGHTWTPTYQRRQRMTPAPITNGGRDLDWWHHPLVGPYHRGGGRNFSAYGSWKDDDFINVRPSDDRPKGTDICHKCLGFGCSHCEHSGHWPPPSHFDDDDDQWPPKGTDYCNKCDGYGCSHCENSGHWPPPSHFPPGHPAAVTWSEKWAHEPSGEESSGADLTPTFSHAHDTHASLSNLLDKHFPGWRGRGGSPDNVSYGEHWS